MTLCEGKKQTDDPGQKDRGKKGIREETALILKTTRGFRCEGKRGKKTQRCPCVLLIYAQLYGAIAVHFRAKSETEILNNVSFILQLLF